MQLSRTPQAFLGQAFPHILCFSSSPKYLCRCSVAQSCLTLCDPMDCSTTDFPALLTISRSLLNSCPLSQWGHPTISSSVIPFSSCLQSFPSSESFSNESVLRIRWPNYWSFSFSINSSNEYSGLFSLSVQGTLKYLENSIWCTFPELFSDVKTSTSLTNKRC